MTKEEAIIKAGTLTELARILGVSKPAVSQWRTLPPYRLLQLRERKPEWFTGDCKEVQS